MLLNKMIENALKNTINFTFWYVSITCSFLPLAVLVTVQSFPSLYDTCYMVVECYVFDSAVLTASTSIWCTMVYAKQFTTEWNRKVFFPTSQSVCLLHFLGFVSH